MMRTHFPFDLSNQELEELGASLIGVLETHFHADFVSGHYELHKRFNVPVYFGPGAGERAKFPLVELKDGTVRKTYSGGIRVT